METDKETGKINDPLREEIVQAYIQNVLDTTPEYNKALTTSRVNNPTSSKNAGELSQVDKRTKDATKKFKKVLDWDGKGNPPVNTIMAANNENQQLLWQPSKSGEPARWVLREKEKGGWNTLGSYRPDSLEKIANQLGFDFDGKENKKDSTSKTTDETSSGSNFFNPTTGAIDKRYSGGGGVLKN